MITQKEKQNLLNRLRDAQTHVEAASDKVVGAGLYMSASEAQGIQNEHRQACKLLTRISTEIELTLKAEG